MNPTCMNLGAFGSWANFSAFPLCSKYTFFFLSNWSRFFSCLVIISSVSSTEFELISRVDLAMDSSSHSKNGVSSSVYWKWRRKYYISYWILEFDIWNWWFDSDLKQVDRNQLASAAFIENRNSVVIENGSQYYCFPVLFPCLLFASILLVHLSRWMTSEPCSLWRVGALHALKWVSWLSWAKDTEFLKSK